MKSIVIFIIPLVIARIYNIFIDLSEFPSAGTLLHMTRGFLSDFAVGAFFGFLLRRVQSKTFIYYTLWTLWVLFFSLNIEHVKVNSANASYSFAHLAFTRDFIMGSFLTFTNLLTFIVCIGISAALASLIRKRNLLPKKSISQLLIVFSLVLLATLTPTSKLYPYWAQMNIIEENLRGWLKKPVYRGNIQVDNALMEKFRNRDLAGERIIKYPERKLNVLIVLIEGLGRETIISGNMPYLRSLSDDNLSYTTFISQQRQTHRGLYSLLCGDLPNFITAVAKPDIIGQHGAIQPCLPEVLRRNGYHTIFMQSAELGFMRKDMFSEKAGFNEIVGRNHYKEFISLNPWGIDDNSLYRNAFMRIKQLPENTPWFMTLLTSGTHHPYNVPGTASPTWEQAILYADNSLNEFIDALALNGTLRNTLVIISSDESLFSEGEGMLSELRGNHLPLVVLAPEIFAPFVNNTPFIQADIPLSLVDFLAIAGDTYSGRSIFRTYEIGRHLIFGNMYASRIYDYTPDNILYVCTKNIDCSAMKNSGNTIFNNSYVETETDSAHVSDLKKFLSANELTFDSLNTSLVFSEVDSNYTGGTLLLGGFKFTANAGDRITWRLRLKADDAVRVRIFAGPDVQSAPRKETSFVWETAEVSAGQTFDFEKEVKVPENTEAIWTNVLIDADKDNKYFVKYLKIERTKREKD